MPDWTANEDRYMAEYRGETIYDPRPLDPPESEGLAQALAHAVFVDGAEGMTLGAFFERLLAYGDARVAEAKAQSR